MHNGMVRLGGEKMAKSVGNIRLLHAALDACGRDTLIMYFAGGHYRQPLALLRGGAGGRRRAAVERIRDFCGAWTRTRRRPAELEEYEERFFDALADDFNTPAARAVLFDWMAEANRRLDSGERLGPGALPRCSTCSGSRAC